MMADDETTGPPKADGADRAKSAEDAFIRGLIERGEAAKADEHGNLPPGATHEIIGISESGLPIVKRRRFYKGK